MHYLPASALPVFAVEIKPLQPFVDPIGNENLRLRAACVAPNAVRLAKLPIISALAAEGGNVIAA